VRLDGRALGEEPAFLGPHGVDDLSDPRHDLPAFATRHDLARAGAVARFPGDDCRLELRELSTYQFFEETQALLLSRIVTGQPPQPPQLWRQAGQRRFIGLEVGSGSGDEVSALPGLGVGHQRKRPGQLGLDGEGVLDLPRGALQLLEPLVGEGRDDDEEEPGENEAEHAQPPRDQRSHGSPR